MLVRFKSLYYLFGKKGRDVLEQQRKEVARWNWGRGVIRELGWWWEFRRGGVGIWGSWCGVQWFGGDHLWRREVLEHERNYQGEKKGESLVNSCCGKIKSDQRRVFSCGNKQNRSIQTRTEIHFSITSITIITSNVSIFSITKTLKYILLNSSKYFL